MQECMCACINTHTIHTIVYDSYSNSLSLKCCPLYSQILKPSGISRQKWITFTSHAKKNANGFGTKQNTQASHVAHTLQFPHRRFTSHHLGCIMKAEGGNLRQALKKTFNFRGLKSLFFQAEIRLLYPFLYWTFCKIKRYSSKLFDLALVRDGQTLASCCTTPTTQKNAIQDLPNPLTPRKQKTRLPTLEGVIEERKLNRSESCDENDLNSINVWEKGSGVSEFAITVSIWCSWNIFNILKISYCSF